MKQDDEQELIRALQGLRARLYEEAESGTTDLEERVIDAEIDEAIQQLQAYFRGEINLPTRTIALSEFALDESVPEEYDWEPARIKLADTIADAIEDHATLIRYNSSTGERWRIKPDGTFRVDRRGEISPGKIQEGWDSLNAMTDEELEAIIAAEESAEDQLRAAGLTQWQIDRLPNTHTLTDEQIRLARNLNMLFPRVRCISNEGGFFGRGWEGLTVGKIYIKYPDSKAEEMGWMRVDDDSGEDYLYPATCFEAVAND